MSKRAEEEAIKFYPVLFSERNGLDDTMKDRQISFENGYDKAVEDVFAYIKKHYLLRNTKVPMHWVSHEQVKQKFYENE